MGARTELAFASMLNNFQKKVYTNEDLSDLFENSAYSEREILIMASLIDLPPGRRPPPPRPRSGCAGPAFR